MCAHNDDYAARAADIERLADERVTQDHRLGLAAKFVGKKFVGKGGLVVRMLENGAELVRNGTDIKIVPQCGLDEVYDAIERGLLVEQPAVPHSTAGRDRFRKELHDMKSASECSTGV